MPDSDIKFRVSQEGAEKVAQDFRKVEDSFDGVEVTAKELHERLADLDARMNQLILTQGKYAYTSKGGMIVQRERATALNQLLSMQDQEIEGTKKSTRGLGTLTSTLLRSVAGTGKFSSEVSVLTTALVGGAGLTAGLAVAVGIVTLITQQFSKGGFAIADYTKKIEDLKDESELLADATNEVSKALDKLTNQQMISRIGMLKSELSDLWTLGLHGMGFGRQGFAEMQLMLSQLTGQLAGKNIMTTHGGDSFAEGIKKQIAYFTFLRDEVAKTKEEYSEYNKRIKEYNDLLKEQTEETKKTTKAVIEYAKALERIAGGQGSLVAIGASRVGGSFGMDATRGSVGGGASKAMISRELQNEMKQMQTLIGITAGVLRDEFTQAWEDVFGEANSLFEKFASRIAEYFTELALRQAAMGLFNLIFPGAGTVAGMAMGATSSPSSPSYSIILDGEIVGTFIDKRVPYSINKAARLDII